MKRMKYAISMMALLALLITACKPDKKSDPVSAPGTTDARDKYVGTWSCTEYSKALQATTTYTIQISKSTSVSSDIMIDHFYDLNTTARATVNNSNITIPYQQLDSLGFAAGSGTLSTATQLNMTYTTNINSSKDTCTASCVKQ